MGLTIYACAIIFFIFVTFALDISSIVKAATSGTSKDVIAIQPETPSIESQGSTLKEILDRLHKDYAVEINGLEHKNDTPISFSHTSDTLEDLIKALLRHLAEKNYAFEFIDQKLRRISVFPGTQKARVSQTTEERKSKPDPRLVTVAEVQSVVEGSQADSLGLASGDIILEYDGVKVQNALQLVKEVEKKASSANIEMVIMRDNSSMRYTLVGGFIGVRIQTTKISREDYE